MNLFGLKIDKVYETEIISLENEGMGVAKINGMVVFVPKALQGEKVRLRITEIKKNYANAKLIEVLEKSKDRVESICPYYEECGGCNLRHQNDKANLEFKKKKVENALHKIGKIDFKVENVVASVKNNNYRNKATFKVEDNKIGFYRKNTYQLIDIKDCMLLEDEINNCLSVIRYYLEYNKNNINSITIKKGNAKNNILIDISSNSNKDSRIIDYLTSNVKNLKTIIFNDKVVYGDGYIEQITCGYMFNCSSKSFYQVNSMQTEKLYELAIKKAKLNKKDVVLDLYCGTGTISSIMSNYVNKVIGIEINESAIDDANSNLALNNISNVNFICGDATKKILNIKENIDVIFIDPPRSGVDRSAIAIMKKLNPKKIVYISCNPVTMARDLSYLIDLYDIKTIIPVDMFPNTSHVETVCVLERK